MAAYEPRSATMLSTVESIELNDSLTELRHSWTDADSSNARDGPRRNCDAHSQNVNASLASSKTIVDRPHRLYRNWSGISRAARVPSKDRGKRFSHSTLDNTLPGYPKLAMLLGELRGGAVFRQFSALNTRSILYLQAEILDLEEELDKVERENDKKNQLLKFGMNTLKSSSGPGQKNERLQHEIVLELRAKLKEYNTMLLEQAALNRLDRAPSSDVFELKSFIESDKKIPQIGSSDSTWWMDEIEGSVYQTDLEGRSVESDLIMLSERKFDPFTRCLARLIRHLIKSAPDFVKNFLQIKMQSEVGAIVRDELLMRTSKLCAIAVASVVPIASIFALYYIKTMPWRLGFIMLWSVFFSVCLTLFTTAKTIEIFAASVAMAAIQVVFVGVQPDAVGQISS